MFEIAVGRLNSDSPHLEENQSIQCFTQVYNVIFADHPPIMFFLSTDSTIDSAPVMTSIEGTSDHQMPGSGVHEMTLPDNLEATSPLKGTVIDETLRK